MENKKVEPVPTPEEMQRKALQNQHEVQTQQLMRQGKIIEKFLPAIAAASPKLIASNNAAQGLGEIIQFVLNSLAQRMTLKEIGVMAELDKYINGDANRESKFTEQKKIVQSLEDWAVSDVLFALGWYGTQAKVFIDKEVADVNLDKLVVGTKELLDKQLEVLKENEKLIVSPIQKKNLD